ncbi:MAG TPA: 50S ribosomal protein L10 [Phycisphaerae bacterium]|nr:50S ribosomal protein L10 [Phycisphaerae bacterium]HUU22469.1 50S ribosomal protein L10 [Phycisphaerae bacterium]
MSKPVKALLRKELAGRLQGVDSLVVFSLSGVAGTETNKLRNTLRAKDIRVSVVKNSVARQAMEDVGLLAVSVLLDGPSALAIGGEGVVATVRELLAARKELPSLTVRGALMEGEVFGPDRVEELSRYPTREEALGSIVMLARSPGARLVGALLGPGGRISGALKTLAEGGEEGEGAEGGEAA